MVPWTLPVAAWLVYCSQLSLPGIVTLCVASTAGIGDQMVEPSKDVAGVRLLPRVVVPTESVVV